MYNTEKRASVIIRYERLNVHKTLRVFYTTYDVRRDSDLIHTSSHHADVMLAAEDDPHPFWYARVLGIYHAEVRDGAAPFTNQWRRMEFLFVRWFGTEPGWKSGWKHRRLDRIGFVPQSNPGAFGFLDPSRVLRGCHLIPAFSQGTTTQLLAPSPMGRDGTYRDFLLERGTGAPHNDWDTFYTMRYSLSASHLFTLRLTISSSFVDRDMLMRYIGGGVGHLQGAGPPVARPSDEVNYDEPDQPSNHIRDNSEDSEGSDSEDSDLAPSNSGNDDGDSDIYAPL